MFLLVSELDQNGACESLQDQILPLEGGHYFSCSSPGVTGCGCMHAFCHSNYNYSDGLTEDFESTVDMQCDLMLPGVYMH